MSMFLDTLKGELMLGVEHEVEVTMQVAVMISAKVSKREVADTLGISNAELTMCVQRLERVTTKWTNNG